MHKYNIPRFWLYLSISLTILGRRVMHERYSSWISSLSARLSLAGSKVRSIDNN